MTQLFHRMIRHDEGQDPEGVMESKPHAEDVGVEEPTPGWVAGLMPQRQAEIGAEIGKLQAAIAKLQEEAGAIESMGRLLYQTGQPLKEAVRDVFGLNGLQAELTAAESTYDVTVNLDTSKRLLVVVTGTDKKITNKSAEIRQVFETAQAITGEEDRLVLAANVQRERPVADREWLDSATPDALMLMTGLGAVFVTTATLFRIWKLSTENPQAATEHLLQLHAAAPGSFTFEATRSEA